MAGQLSPPPVTTPPPATDTDRVTGAPAALPLSAPAALSTATQKVVVGHESPSRVRGCGVVSTGLDVHAAAPAAGLFVIHDVPASSPATHSAVEAHVTECRSLPLSRGRAVHAWVPPVGSAEVERFPLAS